MFGCWTEAATVLGPSIHTVPSSMFIHVAQQEVASGDLHEGSCLVSLHNQAQCPWYSIRQMQPDAVPRALVDTVTHVHTDPTALIDAVEGGACIGCGGSLQPAVLRAVQPYLPHML